MTERECVAYGLREAQELDALRARSFVAPTPRWRRWWRAVVEYLTAPLDVEVNGHDAETRQRIEIMEVALRVAKRLQRYERDEAHAILEETARLLGIRRRRRP